MTKLILKPYITEKASMVSDGNAYTFEVVPAATKLELIKEINRDYKVKPVKINIINLPAKKVISRGRFGTLAGTKKAIVFLKKGDSIKFAA